MSTTGRKRRELAAIVGHEHLGGDQHLLTLESPVVASLAKPGNFVLTGVRQYKDPSVDPLLPRPFSLLKADPEKGTIEIFYRVAGRGTALLSRLEVGESIPVTGPLGNGWPDLEGRLVLVAGGVGMPPLLYLAEDRARKGAGDTLVFYGGRTAEHLQLVSRFEATGAKVVLSTDDGSSGCRGSCVASLEGWAQEGDPEDLTICGCGPEPMLASLADLSSRLGIRAYLSLESPMACGIGVCRGCPIPRPEGGYAMCCTDGPIFRSDEVCFR